MLVYFPSRRTSAAVAPALLALLLLAACAGDPNEAFIQGTWSYRNEHLAPIVGESDLVTTWAFDRGAYAFSACCMNINTQETGHYRIIKSEGDVLILELFQLRIGASDDDRRQVRVTVEHETDSVRIAGAGPFTRLSGPLP